MPKIHFSSSRRFGAPSTNKRDVVYLNAESTLDKISINKNYYKTELVKYYYSEYKYWIESFIDIYLNYNDLLNEVLDLIDLEKSL